jgi:hypothetical protein
VSHTYKHINKLQMRYIMMPIFLNLHKFWRRWRIFFLFNKFSLVNVSLNLLHHIRKILLYDDEFMNFECHVAISINTNCYFSNFDKLNHIIIATKQEKKNYQASINLLMKSCHKIMFQHTYLINKKWNLHLLKPEWYATFQIVKLMKNLDL